MQNANDSGIAGGGSNVCKATVLLVKMVWCMKHYIHNVEYANYYYT